MLALFNRPNTLLLLIRLLGLDWIRSMVIRQRVVRVVPLKLLNLLFLISRLVLRCGDLLGVLGLIELSLLADL